MAASWTLLVYMAADNHLSESIDGKLSRVDVALGLMMTATSSNDVNVIVEVVSVGGKMQRYKIEQGVKLPLGPEPPPIVNTGLPQPLTDFIDFGTARYPSTNVAFILWSDGDGVIDWGVENDAIAIKPNPAVVGGTCATGFSNHFASYLTTTELASALAGSAYCKSGKQIAVVAFDACLMGMIEIAYQLRASASFMLACEIELLGALPYSAMISELVEKPGTDPRAFTLGIVKKFAAAAPAGTNSSLAAVDLSLVAAAAVAWGGLVNAMSTNVVADARTKTPGIYDGGCFVDFTMFLTKLAQAGVPQSGVDTVLLSLANAVIDKTVTGPGLPGYGGVSLYYPNMAFLAKVTSLAFASSVAKNLRTYQELAFPSDTGWGALLGKLLQQPSNHIFDV